MNHIPDYVRPGGRSYVSPEGIIYCTDGKLRWAFELDRRRHPAKLLSLLCRWGIAGAVIGALALLLRVGGDDGNALLTLAVCVGAGAAIGLVMFGAELMRNGVTACLVYTMDGEAISCQQVRGKATKEEVGHAFAVWVGGQSQPALQFHSFRQAALSGVRAVVADPARCSISLRGAKGLRRVYTAPQQLETVADYLREHCSNDK